MEGSHLLPHVTDNTRQNSNLGDSSDFGRRAMGEHGLESGAPTLAPKLYGNPPYHEKVTQRGREKMPDTPKDMRETHIVSTYPKEEVFGKMDELHQATKLEHIERTQHGMESPHLLLNRSQLTLTSETQGLPTNKHQ